MVRRRSTVRFRNGALVDDLIRKYSNGSWVPLGYRRDLPGAIGAGPGGSGHCLVLPSGLASSGETAGYVVVSSGLAVSREAGLRKARDAGGYGQPQSGWLRRGRQAGEPPAASASEAAVWRAPGPIARWRASRSRR